MGDVDTGDPAPPLVEVLAHHRDRWEHISRFDDFVDLLRCGADEPESWARLALEGGMSMSISSAKHHDGWCWWNAPDSSRVLTERGPALDVVAAHAAACERNGLAFGLQYSLADWGHPLAGTAEHLSACVRPQLDDLVARYQPELLWSIGDPGDSHDTDELGALLDEVEAGGTATTDAWCGAARETAAISSLDYIPSGMRNRPWIHCRGIGRSLGFNRAEQESHLLSALEIIDLYLEVLAKGGALLLGVGVDVHGTIPRSHGDPIRGAGRWIQRHAHILDRSRPWSAWGDDRVRYLLDGDDLIGIDLDGSGRFPQLTPDVVVVHDAEPIDVPDDAQPRVDQTGKGVQIDLGQARLHTDGPLVWRFRTTRQEQPVALFPPSTNDAVDVSDLLAGSAPGAVVQLGEGRHVGHFTVPESVTLRGLGPDRTQIQITTGETMELERRARLEHVKVTTDAPGVTGSGPVTLVGESARVLGCNVEGVVEVRADDAAIRGSQVEGLITKGADRLCLSHCTVESIRTRTNVVLRGGGEHLIDSCEIQSEGCAIHATNTTGTAIRGNTIQARHCGVLLEHTEDAHVHGNQIRNTMRAVDVDGGTHAIIDGNAVFDGDSGCVIQRGGSGIQVSGNHWERCRAGLIAWGVADLHEQDNQAFDLGDETQAIVTGP